MRDGQDISVIIPVRGRARMLERAVESVLCQGLPPREIIVVDDASDQDAPDVKALLRLAGKRLRYARHPMRRGAAAARNTGIAMARGSLLAFLDSDDCFAPGKLEIQARAMAENPAYDISHTRETWFRRGRLLNQKKKHQPPHGDIFPQSLAMCVVGMSTVMIRPGVFARHGLFDESLPCCEDYEFWLRVGSREPFLLVDEPLTIKHGGRPDQLSAIFRQGMDRFRIRALCSLLWNVDLPAHRRGAVLRELARKCRIYGNGCIKHGRPLEGRRYLDLPARMAGAGPDRGPGRTRP